MIGGFDSNGSMNPLYILAASIHSTLKAWSRTDEN